MAKQTKQSSAKKTRTTAGKTPAAKAKRSTPAKKPAKAKTKAAKSANERGIDDIHALIQQVSVHMEYFTMHFHDDSTLTGAERRRLIGAGVRNYGFIEKAWDIARENPGFLPGNFNLPTFNDNIQFLDSFRQLYWVLEKFLQVVNECMLTSADAAFRDALRIYNNLKEQTRGRVPGAQPLFMALLRFFRRRRPAEEIEGEEPTMKQLERDFNKLIYGKADGEIVIKNEKPRITRGSRTVVDDIHKGKAAIKEMREASIDE